MSAKAKIRHIALRTANPEELSSFYERTFGFTIVGRTPGGAIYMSDGYMNLALLTPKEGCPIWHRPLWNPGGQLRTDQSTNCRQAGVPSSRATL